MASILSTKAKTYQYDFNGEECKHQLQSEADIFIKQLSKKQCDTNVNLEKCLQTEKQFELGHIFKPVSELSSGTLSHDDFQRLSSGLEQSVRSAGNENDNISKSKNISRHIEELALAVKPNSLETKLLQFAITCGAVGENQIDTRPADHPINQLHRIEKEAFGHLTLGSDPSKTAKTILRKRKQLLESVNDPIGPEKIAKPEQENSQWDVIEPKNYMKKSPQKVYTCKPEKLFTIRDGVIVELDNKNELVDNSPKLVERPQSFVCLDFENTSDQVHPRLSEEEIKKIPKFQNYDKGTPSIVLYLKNLSPAVTEEDLVTLFSKYQEPNKPRIIYKLMQKGKMRGQAFIHFYNIETSIKAMKEVNGTVLHGKPIIIHYGKACS